MEYTKRRNSNRGDVKLEVWQRGRELFEMAYRLAREVSDFKESLPIHSSPNPPIQ